jgi:hypothetical protein
LIGKRSSLLDIFTLFYLLLMHSLL